MLEQFLMIVAGFILSLVNAQDILTTLGQQNGISQFTSFLQQNKDIVDLLNEGIHTGAPWFRSDRANLANYPQCSCQLTDAAVVAAQSLMPRYFNDNDALRALLQYHTLLDTHPSQAFSSSSQLVPTLLQNTTYTNVTGGQRVELLRKDGQPTLMTAVKAESKIVQPDIFYKGGLLHIIDSVLQIPVSFPETITRANLSYLTALLKLGNFLTSDIAYRLALETSDLTFIGPNNPEYGANFTGWNGFAQEELDRVFMYHVMPRVVYSTDIFNYTSYLTLANSSIMARQYAAGSNKSAIFLDQAQITVSNFLTANGVLHVVDRPLDPNSPGSAPDQADIDGALNIPIQTPHYRFSTTALGGIIGGAVAILLAIVVLVVLLVRKRRHKRQIRQVRKADRPMSDSADGLYPGTHRVHTTREPSELDGKGHRVEAYELIGSDPWPARKESELHGSPVTRLDHKPSSDTSSEATLYDRPSAPKDYI